MQSSWHYGHVVQSLYLTCHRRPLQQPALIAGHCAMPLQEARRVLHALGVPFFHHELVRQAAVLAIEKPAGTGPLVELLKSLSDSGDLSPQQLHKGLTRCALVC